MTPLPTVSGKTVVRAFERRSYRIVRTRGSHVYLRHEDGGGLVTVPVHGNRDLPPGTLRNILRQANISVDEFIELIAD